MKSIMERLRSNESGFTLIELLIVVGIIVALAAAIVPQVLQFGSTGETAQKTTEKETIDSSFSTMMAEKNVPAVDDNTGAAATANASWGAKPTGTGTAFLYSRYFQNTTSTYFYCWDSDGQITFQRTSAAACTQND